MPRPAPRLRSMDCDLTAMSIKNRLRKLEEAAPAQGRNHGGLNEFYAAGPDALAEFYPKPLFVHIIGRVAPKGFTAFDDDAIIVHRMEGETVEELELRCAAEHPGVQIWRAV